MFQISAQTQIEWNGMDSLLPCSQIDKAEISDKQPGISYYYSQKYSGKNLF